MTTTKPKTLTRIARIAFEVDERWLTPGGASSIESGWEYLQDQIKRDHLLAKLGDALSGTAKVSVEFVEFEPDEDSENTDQAEEVALMEGEGL